MLSLNPGDTVVRRLGGIDPPSIQSLFIEMCFEGLVLASASGFICMSKSEQPVLITNLHNVTGRDLNTGRTLAEHGGVPDALLISHNKAGAVGEWITKKEPLLNDDGSPRWVEHPTLGSKADFVALPLNDVKDVDLYPHDPNGGTRIAYGPSDVVSVVGFPFGMRVGGSLAVWATGFVASEPSSDIDGLPKFLIDCRTRKGQSGSAVIAYRRGGLITMENGDAFGGPEIRMRFLGVYSGRINNDSDIGFVWKASAIAELVTSI